MDRSVRLHLVARICYYLAWLSAALAVLIHLLRLDLKVSEMTHVSGRNLLESAVLLFVICIASEARALGMGASTQAAAPATRAKTA